MTRTEHVAWCKGRALEYLNSGDLASAMTSMASDMRKRADCDYPAVLDSLGMMAVVNRDARELERWITGFN